MNKKRHSNRAVIGAIVSRLRVLVICQPDNDDPMWKFGGGEVEDGETLEAALMRELADETGFIIPSSFDEHGGLVLGDTTVTVEKLLVRDLRHHEQTFFVVFTDDERDVLYLDGQTRKEDDQETIQTRVMWLADLATIPDFLPYQDPLLEKLYERVKEMFEAESVAA